MIDIESNKRHIFDVVGALHEVHKELGAGLNEYCYQEGFQMQLEESHIPFQRELSFHPTYHGREMSAVYRVDFLCKDDINFTPKFATIERYFLDKETNEIVGTDGKVKQFL